ncbi:MAG: hypothetical protein LQ340_001820 [Diploschistes diacapsis]|nr:MAG: hypothetical protein LQ340_001820 [Diploschistes diacapsis]
MFVCANGTASMIYQKTLSEFTLWPTTLADAFGAVGPHHIKKQRPRRKPWTLPALQDLTLMLMGEFCMLKEAGSDEAVEDPRKALINAAAAEQVAAARGVAISSDIVTVIGRREDNYN